MQSVYSRAQPLHRFAAVTGIIASLLLCVGLCLLSVVSALFALGMSGESYPSLYFLAGTCVLTQATWLLFLFTLWQERSRCPLVLGATALVFWVVTLAFGAVSDFAIGKVFSATWLIIWSAALWFGAGILFRKTAAGIPRTDVAD